jgi:phage-related protein
MGGAVSTVTNGIADTVGTISNGVVNEVVKPITGSIVTPVLNSTIGQISSIAGQTTDTLKTTVDKAVSSTGLPSLSSGNLVDGITKVSTSIVSTAGSTVSNLGNSATTGVSNIVDTIGKTESGIASTAGGVISGAVNTAGSTVSNLGNGVLNTANTLGGDITSGISSTIGSLGSSLMLPLAVAGGLYVVLSKTGNSNNK